jgi:type IV pilus assembly protein PilB
MLGELLLEDAHITREQLEEALRIQSTQESYVPLGQILVNRGYLTRAKLTELLRRHRKSARLGELLVRAGHITAEQLDTALAKQASMRQPLGNTLIALGYVTEETLREALCAQVHINFFDLDRVRLSPELAKLVTEKYAIRRKVVPVFRSGQLLVVAVENPTDPSVIEDLRQLLRMRIESVTSTSAKIQRAIVRLYQEGPNQNLDPCLHPNILVGHIRDQEIADLAAKALGVRVLPPYWQTR